MTTDYEVVQFTQHWRIKGGWYYRDCVVRLTDGQFRLYAIPEGRVGE